MLVQICYTERNYDWPGHCERVAPHRIVFGRARHLQLLRVEVLTLVAVDRDASRARLQPFQRRVHDLNCVAETHRSRVCGAESHLSNIRAWCFPCTVHVFPTCVILQVFQLHNVNCASYCLPVCRISTHFYSYSFITRVNLVQHLVSEPLQLLNH